MSNEFHDDPYRPPATNPVLEQPGVYQKPTWKQLLWSFQGRIPRRSYWTVTLLMYAAAAILVLPFVFMIDPEGESDTGAILFLVVVGIVAIPAIWIGLAITVKRWHDRGKSGWWVLVGAIPYIGSLWTLIECGCLRGTVGENTYGPDPT